MTHILENSLRIHVVLLSAFQFVKERKTFFKAFLFAILQTETLWQMVGLGRLELPTSPLSGVRSNQLSYKPILRGGRRCDLTALIRGRAATIRGTSLQ